VNILFIIHNLGPQRPDSRSKVIEGGCEQFTYNMAHTLSMENTCYLLYPDVKDGAKLHLHRIKNFRNEHLEEWDATSNLKKLDLFSDLLKEKEIDVVHFQHVIYTPLEFVLIAKSMNIPTVLSIHDYYYICEEHFLENDKYVTCKLPTNLEECATCLHNKESIPKSTVYKRRELMKVFLSKIDLITAPSKSIRSDYFKIFPELNDKMKVIEIGIPETYPTADKKDIPQDGNVYIAVRSYFTMLKGSIYIKNTIKALERWYPEIKFVIQTTMLDKDNYLYLSKLSNVILDEERKITPHLVWIPSVAKESYSLIASETMRQGLPILCRNKGALGERVAPEYNYLYKEHAHLDDIITCIINIAKDRETLSSNIDKAQENTDLARTVEFTANQFQHLYKKMLTK